MYRWLLVLASLQGVIGFGLAALYILEPPSPGGRGDMILGFVIWIVWSFQLLNAVSILALAALTAVVHSRMFMAIGVIWFISANGLAGDYYLELYELAKMPDLLVDIEKSALASGWALLLVTSIFLIFHRKPNLISTR